MQLRWLGHSTVVLDLGGARLLTDPLLTPHVGLLRRRGPALDPESWRGTSAVLRSHLHHDHAHVRSLRRVGGVPVATGGSNVRWLRRHGWTPAVPSMATRGSRSLRQARADACRSV
ncbi:MAG: MBL fold metallo-hydrolase [Sporichthyaceae bacterium]